MCLTFLLCLEVFADLCSDLSGSRFAERLGAAYITLQLLFEFVAYVLTCEIVAERWSRGVNVSESSTGGMCEKAKRLL